MKRSYKILRALLVSLLTVLLMLPATLYVIMALPQVQEKVCEISESELSKLLGTTVEIGSVTITPYNKITLRNIVINDANADTAIYIKRLGAGISLKDLIVNKKILITYTELIGLNANIYRDTPTSELNIQPIINALKPKDKTKPPTKFDLKVNTVVIRRSQISYDVLSEPYDSSQFSANHISISDLRADIRLPQIKNDDFIFEIKRFAFNEQSGGAITDLSGDFHISSKGSQMKDISIEFPNSTLSLSDITLQYNNWNELKQSDINLGITSGSYITLSDLGWIIPHVQERKDKLYITTDIIANLDNIAINNLSISSEKETIKLEYLGEINNPKDKDSISIDAQRFSICGDGTYIANLAESIGNIPSKTAQAIANLGKIAINGKAKINKQTGSLKGAISTTSGNIGINAGYNRASTSMPINITGNIITDNLNIRSITNNPDFGILGANIDLDIVIHNKVTTGTIQSNISNLQYKNYLYQGINSFINIDKNKYTGSFNLNDDNINVAMVAEAVLNDDIPEYSLHADVSNVILDQLNIYSKYPGHKLSASIDASYCGNNFDNATALLSVNGLKFTNDNNSGFEIETINIEIDNANTPQHISVNSDLIDGRIEGAYSFTTLIPAIKDILLHNFPILASENEHNANHNIIHNNTDTDNIFKYDFTINDNNQITDFVKSPIKLIHPISISGYMNHPNLQMGLSIDAPYLQQKYKLIKNTALQIAVDSKNNQCQFFATTLFPTKKGDAEIMIDCNGANNRIDTDISWNIKRERVFNGEFLFSTLFSRNQTDSLFVNIDINPSHLIFNDTIWNVNPAKIDISGNEISVKGFDVRRDNQFITLNGKASPNPDDELKLQLLDVNLDYIFETLAINNVIFGGNATGTFFASNLFSKEPHLNTPGLNVKNLSYNYAVLGDAVIESHWNNDNRSIAINADINQDNGRKSYVNGEIFPLNDSLDIKFKADKVKVGYMNKFMSAFAKDITGYASGNARLWGNFKEIDMTGDIYAENLRLKIDFTNTYYTATDSIHLRPGYIALEDIELTDMYGNKATLGGYLKHYYFKRPEFEFQIVTSSDFLCYDETPNRQHTWYGRIFGNGTARVHGVPGQVDITVDMTTAPKSTFTFVLSDTKEANEYTFLSFRDKNSIKDLSPDKKQSNPKLDKVKQLEEIIAQRQRKDDIKTQYTLDIRVTTRPQAELTLIMDPIGGDNIKAHGSGDLRLTYNSQNENLSMFGSYILQDGKYNFTLQDIIIKDFIINAGSSITFNGDPFAASLNIEAIYQLNANLTDLDESFQQDKDLNYTNVPVQALLLVSGSIKNPDIGYDLRFPTLSSDVYRKVKSIVSTDDMMSRQILYLLALNRFYTPEYMGATTKGNELVSVASSTISSQLSNILSEINDNVSISPNFRTDKGDFSDMEVNLALSSRLLNNRLLFNGNFGYRDNTMNNNTFIGDFDIEYLLNRSGNLRLKAYNRYNDQNYYVKTALTTQGVGIVYKRDFDNIFSFIHRLKTKFNKNQNNTTDSISNIKTQVTMPLDTIK